MPINVITERDFTPRTFEEAKAHFGKKVPMTHEEFDRLTLEQRAKAFRIATVHNARMVQDARNVIAKAIDAGQTFADCREVLLKRFAAADIPPPATYRLRQAFLQSAQKSYSDARWAVLTDPEIREAFPYLQYKTSGNGVPGINGVRPTHAALHDKVFMWDDPFWGKFRPPWEHNCHCKVRSMTPGQMIAGGHTLWTYVGGMVVPARRQPSAKAAQAKEEPFALKPNPNYSIESGDLDLSALDPDLRAAVEDRLKAGL